MKTIFDPNVLDAEYPVYVTAMRRLKDGTRIEVSVEAPVAPACCDRPMRVKDTREITCRDIPDGNGPVELKVSRVRYRCSDCGLEYTARLGGVITGGITRRLEAEIMRRSALGQHKALAAWCGLSEKALRSVVARAAKKDSVATQEELIAVPIQPGGRHIVALFDRISGAFVDLAFPEAPNADLPPAAWCAQAHQATLAARGFMTAAIEEEDCALRSALQTSGVLADLLKRYSKGAPDLVRSRARILLSSHRKEVAPHQPVLDSDVLSLISRRTTSYTRAVSIMSEHSLVLLVAQHPYRDAMLRAGFPNYDIPTQWHICRLASDGRSVRVVRTDFTTNLTKDSELEKSRLIVLNEIDRRAAAIRLSTNIGRIVSLARACAAAGLRPPEDLAALLTWYGADPRGSDNGTNVACATARVIERILDANFGDVDGLWAEPRAWWHLSEEISAEIMRVVEPVFACSDEELAERSDGDLLLLHVLAPHWNDLAAMRRVIAGETVGNMIGFDAKFRRVLRRRQVEANLRGCTAAILALDALDAPVPSRVTEDGQHISADLLAPLAGAIHRHMAPGSWEDALGPYAHAWQRTLNGVAWAVSRAVLAGGAPKGLLQDDWIKALTNAALDAAESPDGPAAEWSGAPAFLAIGEPDLRSFADAGYPVQPLGSKVALLPVASHLGGHAVEPVGEDVLYASSAEEFSRLVGDCEVLVFHRDSITSVLERGMVSAAFPRLIEISTLARVLGESVFGEIDSRSMFVLGATSALLDPPADVPVDARFGILWLGELSSFVFGMLVQKRLFPLD